MEKLKLADMDIDVTFAVVLLQQTIDDVHQAGGLIDGGKYYEASQLLRQEQDGEYFDVTSVTAKPPKNNQDVPAARQAMRARGSLGPR